MCAFVLLSLRIVLQTEFAADLESVRNVILPLSIRAFSGGQFPLTASQENVSALEH